MEKYRRSLAIIITIFCFQLFAQTKTAITADDIAEIKKFTSLYEGNGHLLNPPRGSVAPEVLQLHNYIQQLIEELAGSQLASRGVHYIVNIYGSNEMNAWVRLTSGNEAAWNRVYPDKIWPLRKAWGIANDSKSIYEIGVTTALINTLSTKDELAFVLAHELNHLLEGHADGVKTYSDAAKEWWSSQSHETVVDHLGIDTILGKYELDAALSVMDILHPKREQTISVEDALMSGVNPHHAEGVRISALQFYIEYLRRFNEKAVPRKQIAIPEKLRLNKMGRVAPEKVNGDNKAIAIYFELIEGFLQGKHLDVNLIGRHSTVKSPLGSPESKSYANILKQTVDVINSSNVSKISKMDTFVQAMVFLGSRISYFKTDINWFYGFSEADSYELARFLVTNTSGEDAWTSENYKSLMAPLPYESRFFFEMIFLGNTFGQKMFTSLMKVSANWRRLVHYLSSIESFQTEKIFQMKSYAAVFSLVGDHSYPEGPLRDLYRTNLLRGLNTYPNSAMLMTQTGRQNIPAFSYLRDLKKKDASEAENNWSLSVQRSIDRHLLIYKKILLDTIVKTLSAPTKSELERSSMSKALHDLEINSLNSVDRDKLMEAYDKEVQANLNPMPSPEYRTGFMFSIEEIELAISNMDRFSADRQKVLDYIRFLLISEDPLYSPNIETLSSHAREIMMKIVSNLTKEEIWSLSETLSPLEKKVRQEISAVESKYHLPNSKAIIQSIREINPHIPKEELDMISEKSKIWSNAVNRNIFLNLNMLQMFENYFPNGKSSLTSFGISDLKRLLDNIEAANRFYVLGSPLSIFRKTSQKAAISLFGIFYRNIDSFNKLSDLLSAYERVIQIAGIAFTPSLEQEARLRKVFEDKLVRLDLAVQMKWLENLSLRKALGAEFVGRQMAFYVSESARMDRKKLKQLSDEILAKIKIQQDWPDAYQVYRENLAEIQKVQPHELTTVFSEDSRSMTEKANKGSNLIRGMSLFSTYARSLSSDEQIQMIEFMMGRSVKMPNSMTEVDPTKKVAQIDIKHFFLKMREELKFRTLLERSMVVNSILTGTNSLISNFEGLQKVNNHLLKAVSPQKREVAEILLKALATAEGRNLSLILAYALSQKAESKETDSGLTEALVLRSLLDSYGAPGVKLAQYLAFTSAFKDLQSALEVYQDAAMPISYYDALLLIQKRLGASWDPNKYQVLRIIGSGSINIAIEYLNLQTGKSEVVSIARDEIEVKTKEDFRRFRLLVNELTRTPALKKQFGFVTDLMSLIERSVTLEFNKAHSFKMQKQVQKLYNRKVRDWNIRTVDAYSVLGMAVLMEKAEGVGARKVLKIDPATYEAAMRAFMEVEYAALRGVNQTDNWIPMELHANPDIHDGQIMIDKVSKTVTVLDFGQAVEITNQEREFALDLLAIISKTESLDSIEKIVQKYSLAFQNRKADLNKIELAEILKSDDRMDTFVHLLGHLQKAGFEVPLSTVHWILASNRLVKLGEKVRLSSESSLKWLIGMRKIGIPLAGYNAAKDLGSKVINVRRSEPTCSAIFTK